MSDSQNMSDEVRARLRAIPSVNELLAEWPVVKATGGRPATRWSMLP